MAPIAILGPGGVGGFLAAALARAGEEVTVLARESTAQEIADHGIEVKSARLGSFRVRPQTTAILEQPPALLIVATKATTLPAALERIQAEPKLTLPMLNGLEHMQLLRRRFGSGAVAAATIRIESSSPTAGHVLQTSPFLRVELAADDPALARRLEPVAEMFARAQIPVRLENSEAQVLWSKLVRLVALALTTTVSDRTIGFIRADPGWREALEACIHEAAAVAAADGAAIDPAGPLGELEEAHAGLSSSMQRDLAAGRRPELDAIAGAVLRAGERHGIECPTIARLSRCVADRAGLEPTRA